jgi:hypothetical protein
MMHKIFDMVFGIATELLLIAAIILASMCISWFVMFVRL